MEKRFFWSIVLLTTLAFQVMAQDVVTGQWRQTYLGANGAMFYDGPVFQGDMTWDLGSRCFGTIWFSTAANVNKDFDKEVDFIAGCGGAWGKVNYTVDMEYFVINPLIDVANANIELGWRGLFSRLEFYTPVEKGGPQSGQMAVLGWRQSFNLSPRWQFDLHVQGKYDTGAFGFDDGWLAQGRTGLTFTPGWNEGRTSLNVGVKWATPLSVDDSRETDTSLEVGFAYRRK